MKPSRVVKYLKTCRSDELRTQILNDAWAKCNQFFSGLELSMVGVAVDNLKVPTVPMDLMETNWSFGDFAELYDSVHQIDAKEDEIKEKIYSAAEQADAEDWNIFYRPILKHSLHNELPVEIIKSFLFEKTGYR